MLEISSRNNPLIKEIKSLYRKKDRMRSKSFIIEGIKIIEEALFHGYPLRHIVYTDKLLSIGEGKEFFQRIKNLNNLVYVPENIFKEISDTENPQGILAVAELNYKTMEELELDKEPSLLFLDSLQDPGNMGTIIRSADAFNIDGVIITPGSVDPYNPKVVRATMGSIFRTPLYYSSDNIKDLKEMQSKGIILYSTSLNNSIPIKEADFKEGFVLIIGNESKGVGEEFFSLSNQLIKIPMPGGAESLNAGVAASIIMYEVMKQRS